MLSARRSLLHIIFLGSIFLLSGFFTLGFQVRQEPSRFDPLVIYDPSNSAGVSTLSFDSFGTNDPNRIAWQPFLSKHGSNWKIYLDGRSGAPLLVEGQGIPLIPGTGNSLATPATVTLDHLEKTLRQFMRENLSILLANDTELVLNRDASVQVTPEVWQVVFNRTVGGISVAGDRYIFSIGHGNLISFGATRWGRITTSTVPSLTSDTALQNLYKYMGLTGQESIEFLNAADLLMLSVASQNTAGTLYEGAVGNGYDSALAWKIALRVSGEPGTWVGMVDAHTGNILALYDDNKYAQVKGGVYPESDDKTCPSGCEQPNYPMPFADISVAGTPQTANSMGMFDCSSGGSTAATTLNGPYVYIHDNCGAISESVLCDNDIDLSTSTDTDCVVPSGSSAGNTHASRTGFFHLNKAKEHARAWLPDNSWLKAKLTENVNINSTCNAYWDGTVNFYKSGGGCNNTGEIAGVVLHEWGHGFDENDGGGYDNPSEAYADTSEFMYDHTSCIGRGFFQSGNCSGYGNACLECTGIRDMDWNKRADHQPTTPQNWDDNCGGGGSPCGSEEHCEGYIAGETMWDLAARDLPANGYDQATAWQITDRIWFKSRAGSTGNAYNCSLPNSDGCGSSTWFTKLRTIDDDNGNLNDGTPHAAAIFAAFNRHNIACGTANDNSNKNYSTCPSIGATTLSGTAGSESASLSWTAVTNASSYYVLRNDIDCNRSFTIVATVSGTTYTDTGLPNDFPLFYRIQPIGSNSSCLGPVSNCLSITPQPFAGSISFDRYSYNCQATIKLTVRDANVGASTVTATVWSATESSPETIVLNETPPGSSKFYGTIAATSNPPAHDGLISIQHSDSITAQYIDADDGLGGHNLVRQATSMTDCVGPAIRNVSAQNITDTKATVNWTTDELSDSVLTWGPTKPPTNVKSSTSMVTSHSHSLTGLQTCTVYYYQVSSTDSPQNTSTDNNAGQFYRFETLRYDPQSGYESCHAGRVYLDRGDYGCSDTLNLRLVDLDLDMNKNAVETVILTVTSSTETTPEQTTLIETGISTGTFTGTIQTDPGTPAHDGKVQMVGGDLITVSYHDADDGSGSSAVSYTTAVADCKGPIINDLKVTDKPPFTVTVSWSTSESSTARIDYGKTTSLGKSLQDPVMKTAHTFDISDFEQCDLGYFKISSTDIRNNSTIDDRHGLLYAFETQRVPGAVMVDGFEKPSGWTMTGEFEIDSPKGKGGSGGGSHDPTTAQSGSKVLGTDLSGLGSFPGDYEPSSSMEAVSPEMDTRNLENATLTIQRYLNTEYGQLDEAVIWGYKNGWELIWHNNFSRPNNDSTWVKASYDISSLTDRNSHFQIKFTIVSNGTTQESGWNVDSIVIKDGSLPDGEQCGGCSNKPSFGGITSGGDLDRCADTGAYMLWEPAPSWGSGASGTYAVYRDTVPNFTPSSSNLKASGITSDGYTDVNAPNDTTLYYLVRAENNETCSNGPANSGVTDDNAIYFMIKDEVTHPVPPGVGSSVYAKKINDAHVRLNWTPVTNAAWYHIYRADNPKMIGAAKIGTTSGTQFEDLGELTNSNSRYYYVKAVNACGVEGP